MGSGVARTTRGAFTGGAQVQSLTPTPPKHFGPLKGGGGRGGGGCTWAPPVGPRWGRPGQPSLSRAGGGLFCCRPPPPPCGCDGPDARAVGAQTAPDSPLGGGGGRRLCQGNETGWIRNMTTMRDGNATEATFAQKWPKSAKIARPGAQNGLIGGPKLTEIGPLAAPNLTKIDRFGAPVSTNMGRVGIPNLTEIGRLSAPKMAKIADGARARRPNACSPVHPNALPPNITPSSSPGYLTPAVLGAHVWAQWLHHPCLLGGPQHGDKKGGKRGTTGGKFGDHFAQRANVLARRATGLSRRCHRPQLSGMECNGL